MKDNSGVFLVYINKVGTNYKGENIYEFLFSKTPDKAEGEDWDKTPANNMPNPPEPEIVDLVKVLKTKIKLELIQESTYFGMYDSVDGIVAVGWENLDEDGEDFEVKKRLVFKFGDTFEICNGRLYERDIVLKDPDKVTYC